jgi:hypothetical protein
VGKKIQTKPKPARPETRGYPTRNRPIAILTQERMALLLGSFKNIGSFYERMLQI